MKRAMLAVAAASLILRLTAVLAEDKPLTFKSVPMMGGINYTQATEAGFRTQGWSYAHFTSTSFKASDGEDLAVLYADFKNAKEAKRFLDWKVERAFKVLSAATNTYPNETTTEYRAEVVPESDHSGVEVMWVVGVTIHMIRAQKLADALELEKSHFHSSTHFHIVNYDWRHGGTCP
jgi:hypothetical protein